MSRLRIQADCSDLSNVEVKDSLGFTSLHVFMDGFIQRDNYTLSPPVDVYAVSEESTLSLFQYIK
jgi:hypothetical protein